MSGVLTRRPTPLEMLAGVAYLATVVGLTWLALADAYTYAYWVRFVILLPSSLVALCFDYFVAVLLFGPEPTTWVVNLYFTVVAIVASAIQLLVAWMIRSRAE
jgi:hypothetical protein